MLNYYLNVTRAIVCSKGLNQNGYLLTIANVESFQSETRLKGTCLIIFHVTFNLAEDFLSKLCM